LEKEAVEAAIRAEADRLAAIEAARLAAEEELRKKEEEAKRLHEEAILRRKAAEEEERRRIAEEKARQNAAATIIQAWQRRIQAMVMYAEKKRLYYEAQDKRASTILQNAERTRVAKKIVAAKREEKYRVVVAEAKASTVMQKMERSRAAKKVVAARREEVKQEFHASLVLQCALRMRKSKKIVTERRAVVQAYKSAEMSREKAERKEMRKCDFDADKVGWDLEDDMYAKLNRPLTYAELRKQEMSSRRRGKTALANLVRRGVKYDEEKNDFHSTAWYGGDIHYAPLFEEKCEFGHGAEVRPNSARSVNVEDDIPVDLKVAKTALTYDLSSLYEDEMNEPSVVKLELTDKWDWEGHFQSKEDAMHVPIHTSVEKDIVVIERAQAERTKKLQFIDDESETRKEKLGDAAYKSAHAQYPIILMPPSGSDVNSVIATVESFQFVYFQVPFLNHQTIINLSVAEKDGNEVDFYVQENTLPTLYSYKMKKTGFDDKKVVVFPTDRLRKSGNLYVGVYTNCEKCRFELNVSMSLERVPLSVDRVQIEKNLKKFQLLQEFDIGQLVHAFEDSTKLVMKIVDRDTKEQAARRMIAFIGHDSHNGDDAKSDAHLVADENEFEDLDEETETVEDVMTAGWYELADSGISIKPVKVKMGLGGGIMELPIALTRAADEQTRNIAQDIDLYNAEELLNISNNVVFRVKRAKPKPKSAGGSGSGSSKDKDSSWNDVDEAIARRKMSLYSNMSEEEQSRDGGESSFEQSFVQNMMLEEGELVLKEEDGGGEREALLQERPATTMGAAEGILSGGIWKTNSINSAEERENEGEGEVRRPFTGGTIGQSTIRTSPAAGVKQSSSLQRSMRKSGGGGERATTSVPRIKYNLTLPEKSRPRSSNK
jgi:uncharacterized protein YlbG (UPF0298 family)